jgi:hypothetical protein
LYVNVVEPEINVTTTTPKPCIKLIYNNKTTGKRKRKKIKT